MAKCGVLENLLLKDHTHTFVNSGGDVRELDFRFFVGDTKIGAPFHGARVGEGRWGAGGCAGVKGGGMGGWVGKEGDRAWGDRAGAVVLPRPNMNGGTPHHTHSITSDPSPRSSVCTIPSPPSRPPPPNPPNHPHTPPHPAPPRAGLKAFFTTPQLSLPDKIANSLALGTSPIVRSLVDPEGGMRDVRALDNVSFSDWFMSHGGSRSSITRMWDPIGEALRARVRVRVRSLVRVFARVCVSVVGGGCSHG
jgi:hypothetical protein